LAAPDKQALAGRIFVLIVSTGILLFQNPEDASAQIVPIAIGTQMRGWGEGCSAELVTVT
jgi:hypothetical protein